jgi:hypothetical protein
MDELELMGVKLHGLMPAKRRAILRRSFIAQYPHESTDCFRIAHRGGCDRVGIFAQTRVPYLQETFGNLDFSKGAVGEMPPVWHLGPEGTQAFTAKIVSGFSCNDGARCAQITGVGPGLPRFFLYQNFDAAPQRERLIRYRAAVRAEVPVGSYANLLVRVHRLDNSTSFYDDMGDRPITSKDWTFYEIRAVTDKDSRDIEFGIQLHGRGEAWIDHVTLDFFPVK